jgi:anthranilate synthase/aminodeoxychorismate synthase-like glutamine amidotransferase
VNADQSPCVLMIDNYDSFTFNLVQSFQVLGARVLVHRNDTLTVAACLALAPSHVVVSPGPGTPDEAGISLRLIEAALGRVPLLGVCLGHQALAQVLGGRVIRAPRLMHGKSSLVHHDGEGVYAGLSEPFEAGRYHSLIVDDTCLPSDLTRVAWTVEGELMGLRHREALAEGVQFHPESVLTPEGDALLANFLRMGGSDA